MDIFTRVVTYDARPSALCLEPNLSNLTPTCVTLLKYYPGRVLLIMAIALIKRQIKG